LFVWRTVTDVAVQDNKGRPTLGLLENLQSMFDKIDVVCIAHAQDVPTIT
jgi:hypothetical protein